MTQVVQETNREGSRALWFGLLTGPVVYSLHFLIVYLLVEAACRARLPTFTVLGLDSISIGVAIATLIAALITGFSTYSAYHSWRRARPSRQGQHENYSSLMGLVGLWLSGFFTIVILLTGLPALFLVVCDWI